MENGNNVTALTKVKDYLADDRVRERFEDMLDKQAGAFINSVINVVRNSYQLLNCEPSSIMSAAMVAASLNLPIDPALGQAAIVAYGKQAHFQIMYKGVTQLCIRSGQYRNIHCTEVYKDEIESWNPVMGKIKFTDQAKWEMRKSGKPADVVGHYARLELLAGFEKCDYMTTQDALSHAEKHSKAYQKDLRENKRASLWSTNPVVMGNKTVLLRLLTKYGVMSIEMQQAISADSVDFNTAQEMAEEKIHHETGSEPVDIEPENNGVPDFMKDE